MAAVKAPGRARSLIEMGQERHCQSVAVNSRTAQSVILLLGADQDHACSSGRSLPRTGKCHDLTVVSIEMGLTMIGLLGPECLAKQTCRQSGTVPLNPANMTKSGQAIITMVGTSRPLLVANCAAGSERCPSQRPVPTIRVSYGALIDAADPLVGGVPE